MKKYILISCFSFTACVMDSINITQLVNNTGEDIRLAIYYNKGLLDGLKVRSCMAFLKQHAQQGGVITSIDTVAVAVIYEVPKNESLVINRESGPEPDFASIDSVTIRSSRRTISYTNTEILKMLKSKGDGFWELRVQ